MGGSEGVRGTGDCRVEFCNWTPACQTGLTDALHDCLQCFNFSILVTNQHQQAIRYLENIRKYFIYDFQIASIDLRHIFMNVTKNYSFKLTLTSLSWLCDWTRRNNKLREVTSWETGLSAFQQIFGYSRYMGHG